VCPRPWRNPPRLNLYMKLTLWSGGTLCGGGLCVSLQPNDHRGDPNARHTDADCTRLHLRVISASYAPVSPSLPSSLAFDVKMPTEHAA
jgi:hypothetical protein